jgi:hypothetical protein
VKIYSPRQSEEEFLMTLIEFFDIVEALSFLATAGIAYKIYNMQKKDSEKPIND